MGPDPEPDKSIGRFNCECAITVTYSDGPVAANLLQMKRGVTGIAFEEFVRAICELLNLGG